MAKVYATWPHHMVQMGRESTAGTAVAASTVWRGPYSGFQDDRKRESAEENIGLLVKAKLSYDTWLGAKIGFPETALTFEQVAHLFEAGIQTATPSGTAPSITRLYKWATDGTAQPAIKTYTMEAANTLAIVDGRKLPFCWVSDFTLSDKNGESWKMSGNWMAQRLVALSAFTTAIAKPAVEVAKFANTKLYIDGSGGTVGTTQLTGVLMGLSIKVNSGIEWVPVGDGNLYPVAIKRGMPSITYSLTLELEQDASTSTVATERAAYESDAYRLIRAEILGTGSKKITWDAAARYQSVGQPSKEGETNTTVTFEGEVEYSTVDDLFSSFTVINSVATM